MPYAARGFLAFASALSSAIFFLNAQEAGPNPAVAPVNLFFAVACGLVALMPKDPS